jgi:tRNA A-37 threonylcarbamoyl transferase component Bud32
MSEYYKLVIDNDEFKISREIEMQEIASKYNFSPKIIKSQITYNKEDRKYIGNITMENLQEMCIADVYGEDPEDIPKKIWDQIRVILRILYFDEGIEYIDITGYNFIEKKGKVYIIDFGDAIYTKKDREINWFLSYFLGGHNGWNPDFK